MNVMQKFINKSGQFIRRNSSAILTVIGAVGVIATAVTAVKATPKALERIEEAKAEKGEELTEVETVKAAAICYLPSTVICAATLTCIFSASVLDRKHQAVLTSAYAALDQSYKKYRAKVKELYGDDADGKVKCAVAKDELEKQEIVRKDNNKILFYDSYSRRYFEADEATVIKAEYLANRSIMNDCYVSLAEFYYNLGLSADDKSWDYIGWNCDTISEWTGVYWLDFHHDKTTLEDGLEATVIWYDVEPMIDYMSEYIDIPDDVKRQLGIIDDSNKDMLAVCYIPTTYSNNKECNADCLSRRYNQCKIYDK